jgi:cytochrome c oxidase cbb3-type subunit 3
MANKPSVPSQAPVQRIDEATGEKQWAKESGWYRELDTPMPRWWLWDVSSLASRSPQFMSLYPAYRWLKRVPRVYRAKQPRPIGRGNHSIAGSGAAYCQRTAMIPIERLPEDGTLMQQVPWWAPRFWSIAFSVTDRALLAAWPAPAWRRNSNLNDDDWLWGGDLKEAIEHIADVRRWGQQGDDYDPFVRCRRFSTVFEEAQIEGLVTSLH